MSYVKEALESHLEYIALELKDKEEDIARYEGYLVSLKKTVADLYAAQKELNEALKENK